MKRPMYHAFEINKANEELAAENLRLTNEVERLNSEVERLTGELFELQPINNVEISRLRAELATARADAIKEAVEKVNEHATRYRQTGYEDAASVAESIADSLERPALAQNKPLTETDKQG